MFLEGLTEMSGCSQTSTNRRKMLRPKEILLVEEVIKVFEETFFNPFSDYLDESQLDNIVSGKIVSTEIKGSLITINEKGQEMILKYIQMMNKDHVTDSMMMTFFKKVKYFSSSNVSVKEQKKGEAREIKMQRDILGKLFRSSFDTNSCINVENLFTDALGRVRLALFRWNN